MKDNNLDAIQSKQAGHLSETTRSLTNPQRRHVLKSITGVAAVVAAPALVVAAPASGTAALNRGVDSHLDADDVLNGFQSGEHIDFRFVDSKSIDGFVALGQGTIVNKTHHDIVFTDLQPSVITTENGSYDLSAYFAEYPILIAGGKQHHFWVRPMHAGVPSGHHPVKPHGNYKLGDGNATAAVATSVATSVAASVADKRDSSQTMFCQLEMKIVSPRIGTGTNTRSVELSISRLA